MPSAATNSRFARPAARWVITVVASALLIFAVCAQPDTSRARTGSALGRPGPAPTQTIRPTRTPALGSVPNFVFVLTDDLSTNLISHMPHVRQMQRDGATLSRYYVVDSLCCPSRAAILTGQYPHDDGVVDNVGKGGGYPAFVGNGDDQKTFAVALQRAGYRTGFFGKYLNGYGATDPEPPGWDDWGATSFGYAEFGYRLNVNGHVRSFGHAPQDYLTDVISGMGDRFIATSAAKRTPFMLELCTFAPHAPYIPAPRYADSLAGLPYPRTAAYNRLPRNAPTWLASHRRPFPRPVEDLMRLQYRMRAEADLAVDDLIANVERSLRRAGVAGDTYVVFSSDNGYHMGEYRLFSGKQTAYDTDINVPLVVTGPGVPAGVTMSQLAASIDLAPTFEKLGGADVSPDVDGVSLAPLWHGDSPTRWQRAVLVEHHGPDHARTDPDRATFASGDPPSYRAIRTQDALYVRYIDGETEFYDTATDPDELVNLAPRGVPEQLVRALDLLSACHGARECQHAAGAT